ncbi:MAG TPA: toll/interleukin-1 receptor domain-containing protein [Candidatus Acidoferrum sp.]|nr:toll/interleukin-1 receptor domain-containing protein [Candidatus Acidoferrum sp.]
MSMIPGFEYDLFVSYAHADNASTEEPEGWVTQFVSRLRTALCQRLGASRELSVFCDSNEVRANSRLPDLIKATKSSALFLAIGSPSYIAQDWTNRELESFIAQNEDLSRLFMIEYLPLNAEERYPSPLDENIHLEFWRASGPRSIPMPLSIHRDRDEFSTLIHTLAADLGKKLFSLRLLPRSPRVQAQTERAMPRAESSANVKAAGQTESTKRTVLLAQTTEDLEDEVDQLRSFLQQYAEEIAVLPVGGYPQGGEAFKSAFQSDIGRTDLFVQLLGKRAGRVPPDLPEGYTRFQSELAKSSNVPRLQWRRPDVDPESVTDSTYKAILKSETVIASGLEAFKLQILKEIRKSKEKEKVRKVKFSTVFINADSNDLEIAREVERECVQNALTAILPATGPSSEETRRDLEENLIDCDVLLFFYGNTTQAWIRHQLMRFNKVRPQRESSPKLLAICSGPPPKPEIGISFPDARVIDCPTGWNIEAIKKLITELGE